MHNEIFFIFGSLTTKNVTCAVVFSIIDKLPLKRWNKDIIADFHFSQTL